MIGELTSSFGFVVAVLVVAVLILLQRPWRPGRDGMLLKARWFGSTIILIGAALPERLDFIAIALWVAIAWLILLVVAEAGVLGAVALFLYVGLGAAEIALIVYLVVRLVRRVRGKR